jgi:hypothetical protein
MLYPIGLLYLLLQEFKQKYHKVGDETATTARLWRSEFTSKTQLQKKDMHLLSGSMLQLLPTIQKVVQTPGSRIKQLRVRGEEGWGWGPT